jgi:hypothetical protein
MKLIRLQKAKSIRFHRWSRAKYAVFCSLGCTVTIGTLVVSIADKSLSKAVGKQIITINSNTIEADSADKLKKEADSELLIQQLPETILPEQFFDSTAKSSIKPIFI